MSIKKQAFRLVESERLVSEGAFSLRASLQRNCSRRSLAPAIIPWTVAPHEGIALEGALPLQTSPRRAAALSTPAKIATQNQFEHIHPDRVPTIAGAVAGRRAIRRPFGLRRGVPSDGKGAENASFASE